MNRGFPRSRFSLPPIEHWPPALRVFLRPLSPLSRIVAGIVLSSLILVVFYLDMKGGNEIDFRPFYSIIVLLAFAVFRLHGIWWLIASVICRQINLSVYHTAHLRLEFLDDLVALITFGAIGLLITSIEDGIQEIARSHETLRRDLILARETQREILPKPLRLPWVLAEGRLRPVGEVGGDFYWMERLSSDSIMFALGDVQGKGVAAALSMVKVSALFSELCRSTDSIGRLLNGINERLCAPEAGMVTVFAGILEKLPEGKCRLSYGKAGHESGIYIRHNLHWMELSAEGVPLGVLAGEQYEEKEIILSPRDRLLLFTDGMPDARAISLESFGRERIAERASVLAGVSPDAEVGGWLDALLDEVETYRGDWVQEDDMAALGIVILP